MNRRIFGRKASGILAALGFGAAAKADVVDTDTPSDKSWRAKTKGVRNPRDYGFAKMFHVPAETDADGVKYENFIWQFSECRRVWKLEWKQTNPDGKRVRHRVYMRGNKFEVIKHDAKEMA